MSRTITPREAWTPQTVQERDLVLRELQEVIASPHFCNSKRYPALLRYIVENTLAGKADLLKERTLGIEVFDRPPTYDTNADTVVRYTAGEVRKRLLLYYSESDRKPGIRISLPTGSYIPEFIQVSDEGEEGEHEAGTHTSQISATKELTEASDPNYEMDHSPHTSEVVLQGGTKDEIHSVVPASFSFSIRRRSLFLGFAVLVFAAATAGIALHFRADAPIGSVQAFWGPLLHDQHAVIVCTGGVVFKQENFSGVVTASKDNEYPFVSMQIASAIMQVSELVERFGDTAQLLPSPTTPLTELREHPVILLGGYNNRWTMRLLQSQKYHFTVEPVESIADRTRPDVHWTRDRSIPYSSADDYAIVARFRDSTTGNWVVVLAGLGRNGSEAATQFATSEQYMKIFERQLGKGFSNSNVEAVIKVKVVDGKTGAPSIEAVTSW